MHERPKNVDGTGCAKVAGIAFAIYLVSFGVALWLDSAGLIPRSMQGAVFAIYAPLIYPFMFILGK